MHLLFLVVGPNANLHAQAAFSILTFLAGEPRPKGIHVFTDAPEFYRHLAPYVRTETLTAPQIQEWRGEYDFFWRIKIKALQKLQEQLPTESIVYLDTDTLLFGAAQPLHAALASGTGLMHLAEGPLATARGKTERVMWRQMQGKTFAGLTIRPEHQMWNAGVVGVPAAHAATALTLALALCDDLCRQGITPRLIEQFSLSVALHETAGLHPASASVGHYWSNKEEWQRRLTLFLTENHLRGRSLEEEITATRAFNFQEVPLHKHIKNTRRRLERALASWMPARDTFLGE